MYERLLREKEQTDLPEHRKREVESSLYFIGEILRKFERKEEYSKFSLTKEKKYGKI